MKAINFLKDNKYFILGMLVLSWVILVNLFPEGYVFGGGDTNQLISAKESFGGIFFDLEGRALSFYTIFYFLSLVGISETAQLSFYLGFVIFGSYLSFWIFSKLIFQKLNSFPRMLIALFYALNLYTLFLFTGNWGYSYFPSLYVFLPVLFGLLMTFLKNQNLKDGAWFCLVLFLASSGFGNSAFALSFAIFVLFLIIFLALAKDIKFNKSLVGKFMLVGFFSLLVSAFWILPLVPQMQSGVEGLATSNVLDFDSFIRSTSSPLAYTFSLRHFSDMHFPQNFYYKNFDWAKLFFAALSFTPIIIIGLGLFQLKKIEQNKKMMFLVFLGLFLFFVMLVARVRPPFEVSNFFIFHLWGFNVLRGYDKTAIYIPFLLASLILMLMPLNKKWIYVGVLLALLAPLPFYVGKLQQTAGYRVNSKKDYREAKMSFLVKIPAEYYAIRDTLNSEKVKSRIATLPATYSDGSGIVYYPKWEFYGSDITQYLYKNNFLGANDSGFPGWNYAADFSEQSDVLSSDWIIETLGMMNAKYIIYHKDAPVEVVGKTIFKVKDLEKRGLIQRLKESDYFILYAINQNYFLPYLSWQTENFPIQGNVDSIERNFAKTKTASTEIKFQEIDPKKFVVNLKDNVVGENLVLAETFNPLWKAYYILDSGREVEVAKENHFVARGYANGWKVDLPANATQIIIEYYPIRLMWRGMIISLAAVLFLIIYLLKYYYVKRKLAKN